MESLYNLVEVQVVSLLFLGYNKPSTAKNYNAMPQEHISCLNSTPYE